MVVAFAGIGLCCVTCVAIFVIWLLWRAFTLGRLGCVFGFHEWTPWWVFAPGGREPASQARGSQRQCLKCSSTEKQTAGYPFFEDGWLKEDWTPYADREGIRARRQAEQRRLEIEQAENGN